MIGFNREKNQVIVGEENELYRNTLQVTDVNLLLVDNLEKEMEVEVKTRYSSKTARAKIKQENENVKVVFEEPQRAITSGQSAVFYMRRYGSRWWQNNLSLSLKLRKEINNGK